MSIGWTVPLHYYHLMMMMNHIKRVQIIHLTNFLYSVFSSSNLYECMMISQINHCKFFVLVSELGRKNSKNTYVVNLTNIIFVKIQTKSLPLLSVFFFYIYINAILLYEHINIPFLISPHTTYYIISFNLFEFLIFFYW